VRSSFKHFGTQQHWDNPKVQWWFGDGAKSLLMLPEEYFGTFDMVLVDLSETVMSAKVTKGLDILGALALLLKPSGIFVKNELYLEKMAEIFKHSLQIHFYDVSVICSQCLILGSNTVDFIQTEPTDHGVPTRVTVLENITDHSKVMHSYTQNPSAQTICSAAKDGQEEEESDPELEEQESSPGILLILEAENAAGNLESADAVKSAIVPALEKAGFTVTSTIPYDAPDGGATVNVFLQEGYVVARTLPEKKYCAFDVHLWSAFSKLENAKVALLEAVQSDVDTASKFRIVAGGMFGIQSWREDEKSRGPQNIEQQCVVSDEQVSAVVDSAVSDSDAVAAILEESLSGLLPEQNAVALILCGAEGESSCDSVNVLNKHASVQEAIPVWACANVVHETGGAKIASHELYACEQHVIAKLREFSKEDGEEFVKKIGVIVVDPSAPIEMAQIIHKIVGKDKNIPSQKVNVIHKKMTARGSKKSRVFAEDMLVLAPMVDSGTKNEWRLIFAEKFRSLILKEPGFLTAIQYNSSDTSVDMATFLSGDELYIHHMNQVASNVHERTGLSSLVKSIEGGLPTFQDKFVSAQTFKGTDYDNQATYDQWLTQEPWGHQTIIQMVLPPRSRALTTKSVQSMLDKAMSALEIETTLAPAEFINVADGCVIGATWSEGNAIVLWDGRSYIGINLFTKEVNSEFASEFADNFRTVNPNLKVVLRDEMPRGTGRVVNFASDIGDRSRQYWAAELP